MVSIPLQGFINMWAIYRLNNNHTFIRSQVTGAPKYGSLKPDCSNPPS